MIVIKRDNTEELYDEKKIQNVLNLAFTNSNTECHNMEELVKSITKNIFDDYTDKVNIENIQNIVENTLMKFQYFSTAKHYIEYRHTRQELRNVESAISKIPDNVDTPWGMLGYITYKRTYARNIDETSGKTEEFRDTILRVLKACQKQLGVGFTNEELKKAYYYLMSLKCSVAGRFIWQLGTKTVDKLGIMSLQNCAFVKIDEPIKPFLWIFDVLMLGTGVGFSVEQKHIEKLPPLLDVDVTITRVDTKDADFIVPDSREGWVSLLEKVLEAFFVKGKSFTYSTVLIRSAGSKIGGFGGVASGPEDLVKGLKSIEKILVANKGKKLTSVDCLDIVNIIATIVVAGNVRRCLPENSLVHTQKGLKKIQNVEVGDYVMTSKGYDEVSNIFKQGKQDVITIYTQDGYFKCTPNHKMAVVKNHSQYFWKQASELKKNDILLTTRKAIEGQETKLPPGDVFVPELDDNIAWFVGYIQNKEIHEYDKSRKYFSFKYSKNEYRIALRVKENLSKFINNVSDVIIELNKQGSNYILSCISCNLYDYVYKQLKHQNIPQYITMGNTDVRNSYIAGLIDGNNECDYDKSMFNISNAKSKEFIYELQTLCYSCGFETKQKQYKNDDKVLYRLDANTNYSLKKLLDINLLIKKHITETYVNKLRKISNSFPSKMILKEQKYVSKYNDICKKLCYEEMKELPIDMCDEYLDEIQYCPVKITDIDYENKENVETYDIEVKNSHEFYCNGYLTHNSALIALGDCNDIGYIKAKDWGSGNIPNWRCMSNNSVVCNDINDLVPEFWDGYNGNGEPYGLINLELSRKIGRIKDGDKYPDPNVEGYNPCAEQSLCNYETCCLAEIFLSNITSYHELQEIATYVYRICKHSLVLKCHQEDTENIVHNNMRMGIGITGYMQSTEEQKSWLEPLYEYLRKFDEIYSAKHGFPRSIKITTVKPSGTLSLLSGVTSGCHPAIYQYFIRRIRIASNNNLIQLCKSKGYHVEYQRNFDGTDDKNTMVVEFPCCYPIGTKLANTMSAIDQLETVKHLQTVWSDNSVSCTIYYRLNEIEDIKKWLAENYKNNVKTCSFLLHNEHGFQQAPFEEITKEKYEEMIQKVVPIVNGNIYSEDNLDYSAECAGGVCPIR